MRGDDDCLKHAAARRGALRTAACLLLLPGLWLTGCAGGAHLYNETRDTQGQAAKKAWAEVDLKVIITAERATLQQLLEAEQKTQERVAIAYRDNRLRALSVAPGGFRPALAEAIDMQLVKLVGSATAWSDHQKVQDEAAKADLALKAGAGLLAAATSLPPPTCAQLKNDPTPVAFVRWLSGTATVGEKGAVRSTLAEMGRRCKELASMPPVDLAGEYAQVSQQLTTDEKALSRRRETSASAIKAFNSAAKAYDDAVALTTVTPGRAEKVANAAEKLEKASDVLAKLGDAFAIEALSQERLKSLDDFASSVAAAGTDKPAPDAASKEVKAAILLPRLLDDAQKALAESRKPLALPLLLRRAHEELNVEAARRDIAASETVIALDKALLAVILSQAEALALARTELGGVDNGQCAEGKLMGEAFSSCDDKSKQRLYSATARYLDAIGRLDGQRYRLAYARLAAEHERSLSLSEVSARQWDSLIGTMVGQISDYHAGGFKAEQLSPLINWAALFYIGAGVNK